MYHIIWNPIAGKKRAEKRQKKLEEYLQAEGVEYAFYRTECVGHAEKLARKISEKHADAPCDIICMGGDGTLHEILAGVVDPAKVRLGLIAVGTGNDFAKVCHLPVKDEIAGMQFILQNPALPTDYILLNDTRAINVVGMGIDVDILERMSRARFFKGKMGYYVALIVSLFRFRWNKYHIRLDGGDEIYHSAMITAAGNGSYIGGGMNISPESVLDDGKLNVVIVNEMKRSRIPFALVDFLKGRLLTKDFTTQYFCESVEFITDARPVINADGELIHADAFTCRVVHQGTNFYRAK